MNLLKQIYIYSLLLILCSSCIVNAGKDEPIVPKGGDLENVELKFKIEDIVGAKTRGLSNYYYENGEKFAPRYDEEYFVGNLRVLIYDKDKNLMCNELFINSKNTSMKIQDSLFMETMSTGSVLIKRLEPSKKYYIVLVANDPIYYGGYNSNLGHYYTSGWWGTYIPNKLDDLLDYHATNTIPKSAYVCYTPQDLKRIVETEHRGLPMTSFVRSKSMPENYFTKATSVLEVKYEDFVKKDKRYVIKDEINSEIALRRTVARAVLRVTNKNPNDGGKPFEGSESVIIKKDKYCHWPSTPVYLFFDKLRQDLTEDDFVLPRQIGYETRIGVIGGYDPTDPVDPNLPNPNGPDDPNPDVPGGGPDGGIDKTHYKVNYKLSNNVEIDFSQPTDEIIADVYIPDFQKDILLKHRTGYYKDYAYFSMDYSVRYQNDRLDNASYHIDMPIFMPIVLNEKPTQNFSIVRNTLYMITLYVRGSKPTDMIYNVLVPDYVEEPELNVEIDPDVKDPLDPSNTGGQGNYMPR